MKAVKLLCAVFLVGTGFAALACEVPNLVQIPVDESERENKRTLTQLNVIRYIAAMSSYVDCLREEYQAASAEDAPSMHLSLLAMRNNVAVAEVEAMQNAYTATMGPIEELAELEREECIDGGTGLRDIIIDKQTIVFYTRRDEIFLNLLTDSCPILRANNSSLEYSVTKAARFVDNLCSGNPIGDDTTPTSTRRCLLGSFYPITASEAEELQRQ